MALCAGKLSLFITNCITKLRPAIVMQNRYSSYKSSEFVCDLENVKVKYDVTKSPEDWKYVERILPPITVPKPIPKVTYHSDWKPQAENVDDLPYFVPRNKNHMIPVYLKTSYRGMRRFTYVRKVEGDIWLLDKELRKFLQEDRVRPVQSQVHELARFICFRGDFVNAIKWWLMKKKL